MVGKLVGTAMNETDIAVHETRWANWSFAVGSGVFALFVLWGFTFDFNVFQIDDYLSKNLFSEAYRVVGSEPDAERSILILHHVDHQTSVLMISFLEVLAAVAFVMMTETSFLNDPGRLNRYRVGNLYGFVFFYMFLVGYALHSWEWMCFYNVNCNQLKTELEVPIFHAASFMLIASAPYLGRVLLRGVASLGNRK
ncbi:hypothetical protein [Parvibaculum sp.]|uniref:hypothetical protein n=1 Tax=Parvibaculum sp. TaxID=2024848 RepID=UPI001B1C8B4A|nr:hypothetical protein [Parvibaculum sp.]MBO6667007.1 hypothetical protein [Parvibaculum sp.]MBO6690451.1 hypothetical protein [Parvibaculum sp.]MBO6713628.1 hypothetical protein [Parvibaculum sp.]